MGEDLYCNAQHNADFFWYHKSNYWIGGYRYGTGEEQHEKSVGRIIIRKFIISGMHDVAQVVSAQDESKSNVNQGSGKAGC